MAQIRIQLSQILRYDQDVEIPDDQWERIKKMDEDDAADALADFLDLDDPEDWENEDYFEADNLEDDDDYYGKE